MPTKVVPIHKGIVKNGVLKLISRDKFVTWLQCLSGEVELTVKPPIKHRTSPLNKYYWGIVIQMIADETGASPDDVHQEIKRMFLRVGGDKIPITKSTAIEKLVSRDSLVPISNFGNKVSILADFSL